MASMNIVVSVLLIIMIGFRIKSCGKCKNTTIVIDFGGILFLVVHLDFQFKKVNCLTM